MYRTIIFYFYTFLIFFSNKKNLAVIQIPLGYGYQNMELDNQDHILITIMATSMATITVTITTKDVIFFMRQRFLFENTDGDCRTIQSKFMIVFPFLWNTQ